LIRPAPGLPVSPEARADSSDVRDRAAGRRAKDQNPAVRLKPEPFARLLLPEDFRAGRAARNFEVRDSNPVVRVES